MENTGIIVIDERKTLYDSIISYKSIKLLLERGRISVAHMAVDSLNIKDIKEYSKGCGKLIVIMHTLLDFGPVDDKCSFILEWSEKEKFKVILICFGQHLCNSKFRSKCAAGKNVSVIPEYRIPDIPEIVNQIIQTKPKKPKRSIKPKESLLCRSLNKIALYAFKAKDPLPCDNKIFMNILIVIFLSIVGAVTNEYFSKKIVNIIQPNTQTDPISTILNPPK